MSYNRSIKIQKGVENVLTHKAIAKRGLALVLALVMFVTLSNMTSFKASAKTKAVKKITLSNPKIKTLSLKKGETFALKMKVSPKGLTKKIGYQSSKNKVVTVSKKGKLKAKKEGKATITIFSKTKPKKKVKIAVTVYKKFKKAKKVKLNKTSKVMQVGERLTLKAAVAPNKATVKKVTWKSSNSSVASVSKKGVVTAKKVGSIKITAYAKDGRGAKASCKIVINRNSCIGYPTLKPKNTEAPAPTTDPLLTTQKEGSFTVAAKNSAVDLYVDEKGKDYDGLSLVAKSVAEDIALVSKDSAKANVVSRADQLKEYAVIAGSIGNNDVIDALIASGKLDVTSIQNKRETYQIQVIEAPAAGVKKAIVIAGSDKRGTIYGLYSLSEKMGVSPWVYWGDATPDQMDPIYLDESSLAVTSKEPSVKYRGIFLNDEAPSLTSWTRKKFRGYNENFYEKVYELILRCKGNYLWPAMWSNTFSEDGKSSKIANAELADKYGIVMGTSHHEPLCRAGVEWQNKYSKYGSSNAWDFNTNEEAITKFWKDGVTRNKPFENVYTLGMRGESDSALSGTTEDNIALLKKVITTQKSILKENGLENAPQVLTVYKEVEDFWHGTNKAEGLKKWSELDDVTIMLCDDNFGNMRTLPTAADKDRKGGWGMYYHFDYHGGPTSYEWVNTVQLDKVWEQMTMAYEHGIDDIWIVNVGDLKPMEMNISYFLDMAYDYDTWGANGKGKTTEYRENWVKQQFGSSLTKEQVKGVERLLDDYTWLNGSGKPESISSATYNAVNYNEGRELLSRIEDMMNRAEEYKKIIPEQLQAAYFELVYFPTVASANVARMQIYSGLNKYFAEQNSTAANLYAVKIQEAIQLDKDLQSTYNKNMPGVGNKWEGMMSSPHVGFVTWNSTGWAYPKPVWVKAQEGSHMFVTVQNQKDGCGAGKEITLDDFTNTNRESYTVTVSNMGGTAFDYSLSTTADWIQVSQKTGRVKMQDAFEVSVDWSKVTADATGKLTLQKENETITLNVNAKVEDTSSLKENTFIYANGYASILPGHYAAEGKGKNGTAIAVFDGYGKTGQSVKSLPTDAKTPEAIEDAAYTEYLVSVKKAGNYKLTVYTGPSNNLDRDSISITYGVSVNGGNTETKNTVDPASFLAGEYSGSWANDVKENGRKQESEISLRAGVNTIRIYAPDPAFLLQKLVVSEDSLKASNAGPAESYYVGKERAEKKALAGVVEDVNAIPGKINATEYRGNKDISGVLSAKKGDVYDYDVIVTESDQYQIGIETETSSHAQIQISWNEKEWGVIQLSGTNTTYETIQELEAGSGRLKLSVVSGEAKITSVIIRVRDRVLIPGSFDAAGHEESNEKTGNLNAKEGITYSYSALVEKDDLYQFSVTGNSKDHASVTLYWNEEEVGTAKLAAASSVYTLDNLLELTPGVGVLSLKVTGGEAVIESVASNRFESDARLPVTMTASSAITGHDASCAYDEDETTSWKPEEEDSEKAIVFDFQNPYTIDRFSLTQTGNGITGYEVQIEAENAWKTVYTGTNVINGTPVFLQGKEVISCSKLRFVFEGSGIEINEIDVLPYTNWAMKDHVSLSGEKKGNGGAITVPDSIVDGDRITKGMEDATGSSSDTDRHTVTMSFTEPRLINAVRLITLQESEFSSVGSGVIPDLEMRSDRGQYSYKISYYDGGKWVEVGATQRPDAGTNPKVFTEFTLKRKVIAEKIKVEIYTSHWIRINELEAIETQRFVPDN